MPPGRQAHRHAMLEGLLDHANLLRRGSALAALNRAVISMRSIGLVMNTVVWLTTGVLVHQRYLLR